MNRYTRSTDIRRPHAQRKELVEPRLPYISLARGRGIGPSREKRKRNTREKYTGRLCLSRPSPPRTKLERRLGTCLDRQVCLSTRITCSTTSSSSSSSLGMSQSRSVAKIVRLSNRRVTTSSTILGFVNENQHTAFRDGPSKRSHAHCSPFSSSRMTDIPRPSCHSKIPYLWGDSCSVKEIEDEDRVYSKARVSNIKSRCIAIQRKFPP